MNKVEKFKEICEALKICTTSLGSIDSWKFIEDNLIRLHTCPSSINAVSNIYDLKRFCVTLLNKITNDRESLLNKMCKTYEAKNHDYGDSFGKSVRKYGFISCVTRMSDKFNRYESLSKRENDAKVNESLNDTLLDLLCYSVMTIIEIEEIYN